MPEQYVQLKEDNAPNLSDGPYEALANAVVERAAIDYLDVVDQLKDRPTNAKKRNTLVGTYEEVRSFFTNKKDLELWTEVDGNYLLRELDKMADEAYHEKECKEGMKRLQILGATDAMLFDMWHEQTKSETSGKAVRKIGVAHRSNGKPLTEMQKNVVLDFETKMQKEKGEILVYYCIRHSAYDIYLYIEADQPSAWEEERKNLKDGLAKVMINNHHRSYLSRLDTININNEL